MRGYTNLPAEDGEIPLSSIDEESPKKNSGEFEVLERPALSEQPPSRLSVYTSKVILQILVVSLLAFHKVSSDVIIPTLLATPSD